MRNDPGALAPFQDRFPSSLRNLCEIDVLEQAPPSRATYFSSDPAFSLSASDRESWREATLPWFSGSSSVQKVDRIPSRVEPAPTPQGTNQGRVAQCPINCPITRAPPSPNPRNFATAKFLASIHFQNRIQPSKGIKRRLRRARIRHPRAVHHQPVFINPGRQRQLLQPESTAQRHHLRRLRTPIVESSGDCHLTRRRMGELYPNPLCHLAIAILMFHLFFHSVSYVLTAISQCLRAEFSAFAKASSQLNPFNLFTPALYSLIPQNRFIWAICTGFNHRITSRWIAFCSR